MKTIFEYIKIAESKFPGCSLNTKRYEAELILSEILNLDRVDLYTKSDIIITNKNNADIDVFFKRRIKDEPLQHILGYTYFRELKFFVNPNVLIPRPETELLVDKALELICKENPIILDIGTGSGAIALSVAHELKKSKVTAVDISQKALETAKQNCLFNNITNVSFLNENLCSSFEKNSADMILANLPYVTEDEYNNLEYCVKNYEPKLALHGGVDGLDLVKTLIKQSKSVLKEEGWILLEIGFTQGKKTADLFKKAGCFRNIQILQDYNSKDRIVLAQKNYFPKPN
jgi:release factor glutamine methyltransferase